MAEQQHLMEAERGQIPYKLKNLQADHATWKTKEEEWKRVRMEEFQTGLNEIAHRFYLADEEKKKYLSEREKQLKACQKNYKDAKTELQLELDHYVDEVRQEIEHHKQLIEEQKRELRQAQDAELNGKGADVATIRKYDERLAEIREELRYISEHRNQVAYYEKDKQELFDKNRPCVAGRKNMRLNFRLWTSGLHCDVRNCKNGLKEINSALEKLKQELHILESGLAEADAFLNDETFCPAGAMEVGEKPTRKNCDTLVKELKSLIVSFIRKTEDFKKAVMQFKGYFSAKNTFHFRTELIGEQDYYDFASNLCEFVDNDKISDYQKHISGRYTDIIRRISKEVGDLTRNESEIRKTIGDINDDFIERNFAGVIKEISSVPWQV